MFRRKKCQEGRRVGALHKNEPTANTEYKCHHLLHGIDMVEDFGAWLKVRGVEQPLV